MLYDLVIRARDFVGALIGLILFSPVMLSVALWVRRDSPGPVLYRGARVGQSGRVFQILKFRTMYETPESYSGPRVTAQNDDRVTRLGQWLRSTKINELPQLWNVLIGDMSLVGPRPEDPTVAELWPASARTEILSVRPGITSPASVAYHDEERRLNHDGLMDDYLNNILPDKLRLDLLYVRHRTFLSDLDVIFWTLALMLPAIRNSRIPEGWLFGGPLTRVARRYWNWFVIDFFVAIVSIALWGIVWRLSGPLDLGIDRGLLLGLVLALLFSVGNTLFGLKGIAWSRARPEDSLRLLMSCSLVAAGSIFWHVQQPVVSQNVPIELLVAISLTVSLGVIAVRYRSRLLSGLASRWVAWRQKAAGPMERVLVIGAGQGSEFVTWLLRRGDFSKLYCIIGLVDDDPAKQGLRVEGLQVLGTCADIPALVRQHDVGVLFYSIQNISEEQAAQIMDLCYRTPARLIDLAPILAALKEHLVPPALAEIEGIG